MKINLLWACFGFLAALQVLMIGMKVFGAEPFARWPWWYIVLPLLVIIVGVMVLIILLWVLLKDVGDL